MIIKTVSRSILHYADSKTPSEANGADRFKPRQSWQAVTHGEEAIAYLRGEPPYRDRHEFPLPNVILTDLKMPLMDGFELLHWLRTPSGALDHSHHCFQSSAGAIRT